MGKLRILITGFGPFPGAPYNPTIPLVRRLAQLRRPAFSNVELLSHIFHVSYAAVDRELPKLIANCRPDAMLMFGLAGRSAHVRVETRARNAVSTRLSDADRRRAGKTSILSGSDAALFGPHTARLVHAARGTGVHVEVSRDAGSYLCNYLSWRAIEATGKPGGPSLAAFVHVPLLGRDGSARRKGISRITLEELIDAGEAMLMEMVRLTRHTTTPARISADAQVKV